jgi:DNA modification methylase
MTRPVQIGNALLHLGDSLEILSTLPDESIHSVVCDPPYGIRFMGKEWDGKDIEATMRRKIRKGTSRPDGWERHDGAAFAAGTYDLSPSANKAFQSWVSEWSALCLRVLKPGGHLLTFGSPRTYHRLASGIEDAGFEIRDQIMWIFGSGFPKSHNLEGEWDGWGTALKPAHEPIVVARKPLIGTVAENVRLHGTGALNIGRCRVVTDESLRGSTVPNDIRGGAFGSGHKANPGAIPDYQQNPEGRWPANLIHDGSDEVIATFPNAAGQQGAVTGQEPSSKTNNVYGQFNGRPATQPRGDNGSAARFFYCPKSSRRDREDWNNHPTVKPTELMRYLCRLVTPPGGVVLDPFMGSGSTLKAAVMERFRGIGIEREPQYFAIAKRRIECALRQPDLFIGGAA